MDSGLYKIPVTERMRDEDPDFYLDAKNYYAYHWDQKPVDHLLNFGWKRTVPNKRKPWKSKVVRQNLSFNNIERRAAEFKIVGNTMILRNTALVEEVIQKVNELGPAEVTAYCESRVPKYDGRRMVGHYEGGTVIQIPLHLLDHEPLSGNLPAHDRSEVIYKGGR